MLHLIKFRCYTLGIFIIKLLIRTSEAWHCEGSPQSSPLEITSGTSATQGIKPNLYISTSERSEPQSIQRWGNPTQAGRQIKTDKQRNCDRQLELCAGGRERDISQPGLGPLKPWAVLPQWSEYFTRDQDREQGRDWVWRNHSCGLATTFAKWKAESGSLTAPHHQPRAHTPSYHVLSELAPLSPKGISVSSTETYIITGTRERHSDIEANSWNLVDRFKRTEIATHTSDLSQSTSPLPSQSAMKRRSRTLHVIVGAKMVLRVLFRVLEPHCPLQSFTVVEPRDWANLIIEKVCSLLERKEHF